MIIVITLDPSASEKRAEEIVRRAAEINPAISNVALYEDEKDLMRELLLRRNESRTETPAPATNVGI